MSHPITWQFTSLLQNLNYTSATIGAPNFTQTVAFDFDATHTAVPCWLPVSGNYGRLPRLLFYCSIMFVLLPSDKEWLVAGALVAALTYSGTAAIHACFLGWRGPAAGELDLYALIAILSTSCLITVPLINWSQTLRKLGSRDGHESGARTIIVYWGAVVAVGLFTALVVLWNDNYLTSNFSTLNIITCFPPASQINYAAGQDPLWPQFIVDTEWIDANGCMDPCQKKSFRWQPAIFRSYTDYILMSRVDIETMDRLLDSSNRSFFMAYSYFGTVVAVFIVSQAIWALRFGRRNPGQARDAIYLALKRFSFACDSIRYEDIRRKAMYKYIAIGAYLWAVTASVLSVLVFITNMVAMEVLLTYFPQSESKIHVGAWSPWANSALVIFAAIVGRYHRIFIAFVNDLVRQAREWLKRLIGSGKFPGKSPRTQGSEGLRSLVHRRMNLSAQEVPLGISQGTQATDRRKISKIYQYLHSQTLLILERGKEKSRSIRRMVRMEWDSLVSFWKDPEHEVGISHTAHRPDEDHDRQQRTASNHTSLSDYSTIGVEFLDSPPSGKFMSSPESLWETIGVVGNTAYHDSPGQR